MKKTIITALAVVTILSATSIGVYANTTDSKIGLTQANLSQNLETIPMASLSIVNENGLTELKGKIQKISEYFITVQTEDGKNYSVPSFEFSKLKEFKDLDLKEGTEVSLKRQELKTVTIANPNGTGLIGEAITSTVATLLTPTKVENNGETFTNSIAVAGVATAVLGENMDGESSENIFMASEITANGKSLKLDENHIYLRAEAIEKTQAK